MGAKASERYEQSSLKPAKNVDPQDIDISAEKSAVDKFYGMMKIPRKLADEIIDMEMWD